MGGDCAILTLPNEKLWVSQRFNKLFVRSFYDRFISDQLNNFETSDQFGGKHLIMGTPGIGKSSFALYAVYAALKLNKTVIYRPQFTSSYCYIFCPGAKARLIPISRDEFMTSLMNPAVVYIVDGVIPEAVRAFTVYVSPPIYEQTYRWWMQGDARVSFFPPWTIPELNMLVEGCYSSRLPIGEIQARFDVVGGCPLLIVHEDKWNDRNLHLKMDFLRTLQQIKSVEMHPGNFYSSSSLLIHIFVNASTFEISHLGFASEYVKNLLLKAIFGEDRAAAIRFIDAAKGKPALADTAGKIFEFGIGEVFARFGDRYARGLTLYSATGIVLPFPKFSSIQSIGSISEMRISENPVVWRMPAGNVADFILTRGNEAYFLKVTAS